MQPNNNDPLNQGGQTPGVGQPGVPAGGMPPQNQVVQPTGTPGTPTVSQPVYGTSPDPNMNAPMPGPKRGLGKVLIAVGVVVVVLILAVGGYFVFAKGNKNSNNNNGNGPSASNAAQTSANNAKKTATALDTLTSATLAVPASMSGFQSDAGTGPDHEFLTTGSSTTNGGCELAFGTDSATALPGATINDIVAPGISSLRNNGVTVNGPTADTALVLKDAAGKEYSLPTISYSFTQGNKNAKTIYSIAVTKDGNRTYVRRDCAVVGAIDNATMTMLAQKASEITVTAQP